MANDIPAGELRMDTSSLYREEVVTDRRIGSIRVLTPLKPDGSTDPTRAVNYVGEAQLLTPAGVLPLVFEIDATSLSDAIEKFAAGAAGALERTRRGSSRCGVRPPRRSSCRRGSPRLRPQGGGPAAHPQARKSPR